MISSIFKSFSTARAKSKLLAKQAKSARAAAHRTAKLNIPAQPDRPYIPFDLRPYDGLYRYCMQNAVQQANQEVKEALSLDNATTNEIRSARIRSACMKWGKDPFDTGCSAVQVIAVTEHIISLTEHLRKNHKDISAYLKLKKRIDQRRKLLNYLRRNEHQVYFMVTQEYGIVDLKYGNHKEHKRFRKVPGEPPSRNKKGAYEN